MKCRVLAPDGEEGEEFMLSSGEIPLSELGKQLTTVDLSGCPHVTNHTVKQLAYMCEGRLENINLDFCDQHLETDCLLYLCGYVVKDRAASDLEGTHSVPDTIHWSRRSERPFGMCAKSAQLFELHDPSWTICGRLFFPKLCEISIRGMTCPWEHTLCTAVFLNDNKSTLKKLSLHCVSASSLVEITRYLLELTDLTVVSGHVITVFYEVLLYWKSVQLLVNLATSVP